MKKELLISARFDTAEMDRSVENLQRKLREIYAPSDAIRAQNATAARLNQLGIGGMTGPGQQAYQQSSMQSRRELDTYIREQAQGQEKLTKLILTRGEKLEDLKKKQQDLVKGSQQELEIKEKISRVEENNFRLRETYKQRDVVLNQALDARNKVAPRDIPGLIQSFRSGGFSHGMSQIPGAFAQNPMGMGGFAAGMGGMALNMGAGAVRDFYSTPLRTDQAMGNAVQGTLGRDVNNIYSRRTAFEQMFQPERQRAAQLAIQNMRANQTADYMGLLGNTAMIGGGGAMAIAGAGKGAALGSTLGSIIPGLGTAAAGGLGMAAGAAPGLGIAGKGLYNIFGDERQRALALSGGGALNNRYSERYRSMLSEQMAKDYEGNVESQKRQNPFKTAAVSEYEQNYLRNLQAQRTMGLGNEGFYGQGGFLRKNIGAGFTPEMGLEMAGQIQGAGGSTRMARESVFGNQLQRGMNLTNAGQVLGTLSGGVGGSEASKQATINILAEGMKLGLDDSKFAEENRRFTQAAAEIISRSGAGGEADFQRNAKNFSQFMGENTNKGIDAAKTAYEQYQQISSTTTGPRGVMRAAGFMKDKYLSKLSTIEKRALLQIPEEQLNENNPLVAGLAEKAGTSVQDFVGRIKGVNQGAVSRFKEADIIRDRLKSKGIDVGRVGDPGYLASLSKDDRKDVTELMSFQTAELGYQGQREMIARAAGTVGRPEQFGPGVGTGAVEAKIGGPTGRMEDATVSAMAGDSSTVLKNFNEMRGGMDAAARSAAAFTDQIRELNAQLQQALEDSRTGKGSRGINDILQKIITTPNNANQDQAGKQAK